MKKVSYKKALETLLRELARAAHTTDVDAGAASMHVELEDGRINVRHGTDKALLLTVSDVQAGTWAALWALMESSGKLEYRAGKAVAT